MQCHFFLFDMDDWKLLCYNKSDFVMKCIWSNMPLVL